MSSIKQLFKNRMKRGKVSWLHPAKLERQSIIDAILLSKKYIGGRIIDLGCGFKPYESLLSGNFSEYIGIDIGENTRADIKCSALKLPLKSNQFDTAISFQVLEHVEDPNKMIEEASRVLKKGGYIVITAPMTWALHEEPHDYFRYTKYGLKKLLENNNFKVLIIKERLGFWAVIGQKLSVKFWGKKESGIFSQIIKRPLCAITQMFYYSLDKIDKDYSETLGYIAIAKKN